MKRSSDTSRPPTVESRDGDPTACLTDCTPPQQEAIAHPGGPLLVLAGAGCGKTRVITRRIAYLIATGVPPHDILAITFTNKAANEMRERVQNLCGQGRAGSGVWLSTFHSMCARMLRHHADRLGYTSAFSIYDESDTLGVLKRVMKELELSPTDFPPGTLAHVIGNLKNRLVSAEEFSAEADGLFQKTVAKVYAAYERALRENNALDFDDLLVKVVDLFEKAPEVSQRYAQRFRHVLIDEYQDTNHAQYLIARALAAAHRNICVTGDPDQSIYGWRGADLTNILDFEKDYPDAKIVKLEQNYRSTKTILQAANHLIVHNVERKRKELRTENPEGTPLRLKVAEDDTGEARLIARDIAQRAAAGKSYDDVAVFYRTNAQSRALETALREVGIPHVVVAGVSFYERKEVKDVIAYLRVCANPADDEALERILNVPPRGLGDTTRDKLRAEARGRSIHLVEALPRAAEIGLSPSQKAAVAELLGLIQSVGDARELPVAEQLKLLLAKTGYFEYLKSSSAESEDRIQNCMELVNLAAQYDSQAPAGPMEEPAGHLAGFLETVMLVSDQDELDKGRGVVKLMTLHTAKGLEFPTVYIAGLEEGLLPLETGQDERDLEEERRLFFVGLTRAKHDVMLTYALLRRRYGQLQYKSPSRFLQEIPPCTLETTRVEFEETEGTGADLARAHRVADFEPGIPRDYCGAPLHEGDRVRHPSFGVGNVISISGRGDDARATVRFSGAGERLLLLKYARLEKVR